MRSRLKTKASVKKRFKRLASGLFKVFCACRRHRLCGRRKTAKQQLRSFVVGGADRGRVRKLMVC